jgi:putative tryptophan/tyrosine transport system substrate-binding protein
MRRRNFLAAFSTIIALHSMAPAQAVIKPRPLIAIFVGGSAKNTSRWVTGFPEGMKKLGYVEGRDFEITYYYADGDFARVPALASEIVEHNPDLAIVGFTGGAIAIRKQTDRIPIVMAAAADPAAFGLISNQARPGGNLTGILSALDSLFGKQVELALELAPDARRLGMLLNVANPASVVLRGGAETAAAMKSINLVTPEVRGAAGINAAFQEFARERVGAVVVQGDPTFLNERRRMATLAVEAHLPAVYAYREHVEDGGLVSYGVNLRENWYRAATYVDKILKGAKPGDLPVELTTKFELLINLKAAKDIDLIMPPTLLARADEVIE